VGYFSLDNDASGSNNTAIGFDAIGSNPNGLLSGSNNTAAGYLAAGLISGSASYNVAVGGLALENSTNDGNTAVGYQALQTNSSGYHNTSTGSYAMADNTSGGHNSADGSGALLNNHTGSYNAALGDAALYANVAGSYNTAVGDNALFSNTGANNIAIGASAGFGLTTGGSNIDIGNTGVAGESGVMRIGTAGSQTSVFVAAIRGVAVSGGQPVVVNSSGQLGVKASSARFKEQIKPMKDASAAILSLQPVTFRYKKEIDPEGATQFGLIAEQVARVDPDLVFTDNQGKPFTVRYEEVNAMLLNEFLKQHRRVEDQAKVNDQQNTTIRQLKQALAQQAVEVRKLTDGLQKVSNQLEMRKAAPQVVANE
jgi:hypothetical protein